MRSAAKKIASILQDRCPDLIKKLRELNSPTGGVYCRGQGVAGGGGQGSVSQAGLPLHGEAQGPVLVSRLFMGRASDMGWAGREGDGVRRRGEHDGVIRVGRGWGEGAGRVRWGGQGRKGAG